MAEKFCCERIGHGRGWQRRYVPCGRGAKFERDGKFYCGTHDPLARKSKADARLADFHAKMDAEDKRRRIEVAAPALLAALKALIEPYNGFSAPDVQRRTDPATFPLIMAARAAVAKAEG